MFYNILKEIHLHFSRLKKTLHLSAPPPPLSGLSLSQMTFSVSSVVPPEIHLPSVVIKKRNLNFQKLLITPVRDGLNKRCPLMEILDIMNVPLGRPRSAKRDSL